MIEQLKHLKEWVYSKDANIALVAVSVITNALTALVKMVFGFYLSSGWLVLNAGYFLAIGFARYSTLNKYISAKRIPDIIDRYNMEFDVHKYSGGFLFIIGVTYLLCSVRMFVIGDAIIIGGCFVYFICMICLSKVVFAVYGMIITRNKENPIIRTMKVIGAVDAAFSFVATLYAYMSMLSSPIAAESSSVLGILVSISVMISGIVMMNRRKRLYNTPEEIEKIRQLESNMSE